MVKLNVDRVSTAMAERGLNNSALAHKLGVKPPSVTYWLQGTSQPKPHTLLRLAFELGLAFDDLVLTERLSQPVVAYRAAKGRKTQDKHIEEARELGRLLRPLCEFLPNRELKPAQFLYPQVNDDYIQRVALDVREQLRLKPDDLVSYSHVIRKFSELNAVIVPALWGEREKHGNALHILLPESNATWIYLNLDSNACDFNFWMAHELAHVYTQDLCGSEKGEDFADAFAGAFLFSRESAEKLYGKVKNLQEGRLVNALKTEAHRRVLSPITIWSELNKFAESIGQPTFAHLNIYAVATNVSKTLPTISTHLFNLKKDKARPTPENYVDATTRAFETVFFKVVSRYLKESANGPGWLKDVLLLPLADAHALYDHLIA